MNYKSMYNFTATATGHSTDVDRPYFRNFLEVLEIEAANSSNSEKHSRIVAGCYGGELAMAPLEPGDGMEAELFEFPGGNQHLKY